MNWKGTRIGCYSLPSERIVLFMWCKAQPRWRELWARIVAALRS